MNVRTVSIICPLFNEEKFIERCIQSILEQDYPQDKLEVLFIDGRSTDHTADIVRKYAKDYPFIKLLDNPVVLYECLEQYFVGITLHEYHDL